MRNAVMFVAAGMAMAAFTIAKPVKPLQSYRMKVSEPSDICATGMAGEFLLLADKGLVYKMDSRGKILSTVDFEGYDLEGVCADELNYYISEECFKMIYVLDKETLELKKTIPISHEGGRNEGVEALTYVEQTHSFILATEKDPQLFMEYNAEWSLKGIFTIDGITEVSAITIHNDKWYILSDEASTVFEIDPSTRKVLRSIKIAVINPEGIAFDTDGKMIIVSDDMARLFKFDITAMP